MNEPPTDVDPDDDMPPGDVRLWLIVGALGLIGGVLFLVLL